ncbi:MAG: phenylalanine--tRNA ligase subunit alpha [bacterium]
MELFDRLLTDFNDALAKVENIRDLEEVRTRFLSRKGLLAQSRQGFSFKSASPEERKEFGACFNNAKTAMEEAVAQRRGDLESTERESQIRDVDVTLPGDRPGLGSLHPLTIVQSFIEDIFESLGFQVAEGFDVETDYYNFVALNIPENHPAREMQDTFWLTNGMLLRTQTSACQVRIMKQVKPPFRFIFPGRCFRYETTDASHETTFYQLEGLMVDRDVTVAHLIAVMKTLLSRVFGREVTVRLRPGYFPFVEPGFELDIMCLICGGEGCSTCKRSGWVELLPCGMVHPNVLRFGGINPDEWTGFAFGLGLTRLVMMRYGISDIRVLNSGDLRVLRQFAPAL